MTDRLAAALAELADAIRADVLAELAPIATPDRLLSIDEAAATLGLGRSLLYDQIQAGRLRTLKVGRRRLVSSGAIAAYVDERSA